MLKNNSTVKALSLVLAICLWAFVMGEVNPTIKDTITEIPVELTNVETLEERGLALGEDEEYFTEIVVKGSRSEVNNLELSDIRATADLYGYDEGENNIKIEITLPNGISLEEVKIPEITVTLEELQSVYLPVEVSFVGQVQENLEPAMLSQVPEEVEVKGAASIIQTVAEVRVEIDATELQEESDVYSAKPTAWNKKDKLIKNVTISAQEVDVEAILYHTKQVSLELKVTGKPDSEYGEATVTQPTDITVRGTAEALERITSISADVIDVSDITKNTTIKIEPDLPSGVELAESSKDIGVKIEFE